MKPEADIEKDLNVLCVTYNCQQWPGARFKEDDDEMDVCPHQSTVRTFLHQVIGDAWMEKKTSFHPTDNINANKQVDHLDLIVLGFQEFQSPWDGLWLAPSLLPDPPRDINVAEELLDGNDAIPLFCEPIWLFKFLYQFLWLTIDAFRSLLHSYDWLIQFLLSPLENKDQWKGIYSWLIWLLIPWQYYETKTQSMLNLWSATLEQVLNRSVGESTAGVSYRVCEARAFGSMAVFVAVNAQLIQLASSSTFDHGFRLVDESVSVGLVGTGLFGLLYNKGAIAVSLELKSLKNRNAKAVVGGLDSAPSDSLHLLFINSHFAAHAGRVQARQRDYQQICKRLWLYSNAGHVNLEYPKKNYMKFENVVWLGDLNYRLQLSKSDFQRRFITDRNISAEDARKQMLLLDELAFERAKSPKSSVFHGYQEPAIEFMPTYKLRKNQIAATQMADSHGQSDKCDWSNVYNWKKRLPAWCDRILYRSSATRVREINYTSHPSAVPISDHHPVSFLCALTLKREAEMGSGNHDASIGGAVSPLLAWLLLMCGHYSALSFLLLLHCFKLLAIALFILLLMAASIYSLGREWINGQ